MIEQDLPKQAAQEHVNQPQGEVTIFNAREAERLHQFSRILDQAKNVEKAQKEHGDKAMHTRHNEDGTVTNEYPVLPYEPFILRNIAGNMYNEYFRNDPRLSQAAQEIADKPRIEKVRQELEEIQKLNNLWDKSPDKL